MAQPPTSEPGSSKADVSATEVLRAQPHDVQFETDLAQLAAVFAAHGGGVSPELSNDLALEIVLNEIVVQACLSTGATGAAIALLRDGEMICRASDGATAPALGSRLDSDSGLSGECIRTGHIQRSDDVLDDPRVDREASQQLGVRSVMVMPLVRGEKLLGLFELFSAQPQAFGERDERTIEALAARIFSSLERAAQPLSGPASMPIPAQGEPVESNVERPVPQSTAISEDQEIAPRITVQAEGPDSVPVDSLAADPTTARGAILGLRAEDWVPRSAGLKCSLGRCEGRCWCVRYCWAFSWADICRRRRRWCIR